MTSRKNANPTITIREGYIVSGSEAKITHSETSINISSAPNKPVSAYLSYPSQPRVISRRLYKKKSPR